MVAPVRIFPGGWSGWLRASSVEERFGKELPHPFETSRKDGPPAFLARRKGSLFSKPMLPNRPRKPYISKPRVARRSQNDNCPRL